MKRTVYCKSTSQIVSRNNRAIVIYFAKVCGRAGVDNNSSIIPSEARRSIEIFRRCRGRRRRRRRRRQPEVDLKTLISRSPQWYMGSLSDLQA